MSAQLTTIESPINLIGMDRPALESYFLDRGEKKFRVQQILQWVYQRGVIDVNQMSDLSKKLRNALHDETVFKFPEIISEQVSEDGTTKWLLRADGDNAIETVYIPESSRGTLCISSILVRPQMLFHRLCKWILTVSAGHK
ncbi:MAG: hypothetical protein AAF372_04100, partial [Pseudomonadota bacterium]